MVQVTRLGQRDHEYVLQTHQKLRQQALVLLPLKGELQAPAKIPV